jgi:fluoride exporter
MERYLVIMAGGAIGTLARFVASSAVIGRFTSRFPFGTFFVNITGCFLIGVIMTLLTERAVHANWRLALVVGFLGGYTTFSSFEYETFVSARDGHLLVGLLNVTASVAFGYLAVWLGAAIATKH